MTLQESRGSTMLYEIVVEMTFYQSPMHRHVPQVECSGLQFLLSDLSVPHSSFLCSVRELLDFILKMLPT